MLTYYKFHQSLFAPAPAKPIYHKPGKGKGWPEECPPIRAANAFGFDLLANFDLDFQYARGKWSIKNPLSISSDFEWSPTHEAEGTQLHQDYAWFWQRGQKLPHPISNNVYNIIKHQVKVSTFLYLQTSPDEILYVTDIPNLARPFKAVTALIETDWYPASYPWHCVLELDPRAKLIQIKKGEPLCRLIPLRRAAYKAQPMSLKKFDKFFDRAQHWLQTHGRPHESAKGHDGGGTLDITRTYVKQQKKCPFEVDE